MRTVRFSKVVQKAGKPEVYLLWTAADKDPEFKKALNAGRIMMVHQEHGQTDYGTAGYKKGANEQILIFPKSLAAFEGKKVVGVKYDLVLEKEIPKNQRVKPAKPHKPAKTQLQEPPDGEIWTDAKDELESEKMEHLEKRRPSKARATKISPVVKKEVQKAMRFLKAGKQVQAYEVLQKLGET